MEEIISPFFNTTKNVSMILKIRTAKLISFFSLLLNNYLFKETYHTEHKLVSTTQIQIQTSIITIIDEENVQLFVVSSLVSVSQLFSVLISVWTVVPAVRMPNVGK